MASTLITANELVGIRVVGGKDGSKRIGKVRRIVFHPKERRVVGFIVKRPDLLWMFHRSDLFVSIDGYDFVDGRVVVRDDPNATGKAACKALGVNYDDCVLWAGLPVMTEDGSAFGVVGNVTFNRLTGAVDSFETDGGATANALLGTRTVPASMIRGFQRGMGTALSLTGQEGAQDEAEAEYGAILVSDQVKDTTTEGGVAEKAGQATAVVMDKVQTTVDKARPVVSEAAKKTGEAVSKGAYATGRQIARSKTMFSDFKEEYDKARGPKQQPKKQIGSSSTASRASLADDARPAGASSVSTAKPAQTRTTSGTAKKAVAKKPAPKKKNMFAAFKDEYDKARHGE